MLVLLNCLPTLVRLGCFFHSITMEALTPTRYKAAKFHRIEHSPGDPKFVLVHKVYTGVVDQAEPTASLSSDRRGVVGYSVDSSPAS